MALAPRAGPEPGSAPAAAVAPPPHPALGPWGPAGLLARCRQGEGSAGRQPAATGAHRLSFGHYFMADGPDQGLPTLPSNPTGVHLGVLLHSTDPQGSVPVSGTQQSLLTVTSTTSLYEKALRRRGPRRSRGTTAVPVDPHLRPARPPRDPPLPCCSAPASTRPCSSGKGLPESFPRCATYSGDSQAASRQCQ